MKVQVTRDYWGIQVWVAGVELELCKHKLSGDDAIPTWYAKKLNLFKKVKLYDTKQVLKYFPDLVNRIKVGEKRDMELVIN
jgi:hypothetical protein